ncbi:MAG: DUF1801 domain-containing protein [Bacteroidia bacterium]|nr:DUF1801 domain-containing protein [Bacteroidia bacterium]
MKKNNPISITRTPEVDKKFQSYSEEVQKKLEVLRELIFECAGEIGNISYMEETLKWGEPSYLVKKGSIIRIDWKPRTPNQYAIYFKCTSKLVPAFKEVFGDTFKYEKNRAIIFDLDEHIPVPELKQCIKAALSYHNVKYLPRLGLK